MVILKQRKEQSMPLGVTVGASVPRSSRDRDGDCDVQLYA